MVSSIQTFQFYTRETNKIMDRIQSDPINRRDIEYYRENIAKVKTVDDLMSNYRLYSYALTAFGLGEQVGSPGLIRKVLESKIDDPKSLVNRLGDERYRDFFKSFNFAKEDTSKVSAQSVSQTTRTLESYSERGVAEANNAKQQLDLFKAGVANIKTVDEFLASDTVYKVALTAVGLDPAYTSKAFIREVFLSNAADEPASRGNNKFVALKAIFDFKPDGTVGPGGAQSAMESNTLLRGYFEEKKLLATPASASNDIAYWTEKIGTIKTADEFVADSRLMDLALSSVGLDAGVQSSAFVWKVLTSDPGDPNSTLNKMSDGTDSSRVIKEQYSKLRSYFNFAPNGTLQQGASSPVDEALQETLFDDYRGKNATRSASSDKIATSLYKVGISNVKTVSDFVGTEQVYEYALKAFGIDPSTASRTEIINVLRSDPGDPNSYARKSKDERFVALAAAFNFDEKGKIAEKRTAQSDQDFSATILRYSENLNKTEDGSVQKKPEALLKLLAERQTTLYRDALADVVSVKDFTSNKVIVDFINVAYDLKDLKLTTAQLTDILTGDLDDEKSLIRKMDDDRLYDLRNAFRFNDKGGIDRSEQAVQSKAARMKVDDLFLRQKFEEQAGSESEGARLALYFKRAAGDIKNGYDILADPALLKVVQIAVGLPAESGKANLEAQNRMLERKIDLDSFKDPDGLSRFINRFVALYDLENGNSGEINGAAIILGGGGGGGLSGLF